MTMTNGKKALIIIGSLAAAVGGYFLIKHLTKPKDVNQNKPTPEPLKDQGNGVQEGAATGIHQPVNNPNNLLDPMIGKKVYANQDNAPVYMRDMTLYKKASKDEYVMTVVSSMGDYYSDGVRLVNKFAVHA